jgi:hypothetical protein
LVLSCFVFVPDPLPLAQNQKQRAKDKVQSAKSKRNNNSMQLKLIRSILLLLLLSATSSATTIVVARSQTEIVIGADSKVTDTYGNDLNKPVCKILQAGNLFIAFEGLKQNRQTGFNVMDISLEALQREPRASAFDRVSIVTGFLTSRLFTELLFLKQHDEASYLKKIQGQTFLRLIIAGFERNRPLIFVRQFRAIQINPRTIGVEVFADDCLAECKDEVVTRFLGETEAIDGLVEETPGFWQTGLANGVRRLIETEIKARDEYVGPPIDLLRIDAHGAQWIQKKRECAGISGSPRRRSRRAPRTSKQ